jgi:hypothetical protein
MGNIPGGNKKLRGAERSELVCTLPWISQKHALGIPIDWPLIKGKALQLALRLKIENLACSDGWLNCFKARRAQTVR